MPLNHALLMQKHWCGQGIFLAAVAAAERAFQERSSHICGGDKLDNNGDCCMIKVAQLMEVNAFCLPMGISCTSRRQNLFTRHLKDFDGLWGFSFSYKDFSFKHHHKKHFQHFYFCCFLFLRGAFKLDYTRWNDLSPFYPLFYANSIR